MASSRTSKPAACATDCRTSRSAARIERDRPCSTRCGRHWQAGGRVLVDALAELLLGDPARRRRRGSRLSRVMPIGRQQDRRLVDAAVGLEGRRPRLGDRLAVGELDRGLGGGLAESLRRSSTPSRSARPWRCGSARRRRRPGRTAGCRACPARPAPRRRRVEVPSFIARTASTLLSCWVRICSIVDWATSGFQFSMFCLATILISPLSISGCSTSIWPAPEQVDDRIEGSPSISTQLPSSLHLDHAFGHQAADGDVVEADEDDVGACRSARHRR